MSSLTPRGRALRWLTNHRFLTENPAGSNTDTRKDGIRRAQDRLARWLVGKAWCGTWVANALLAAGVNFHGVEPWELASVKRIEELARARRGPFRSWRSGSAGLANAMRGDVIVLFGEGKHVAILRSIDWDARTIRTEEGNTSSGNAGSQSDGGGSFPRVRPFSAIHGVARVDYPGA